MNYLKLNTNYDYYDAGDGEAMLREWTSDTERGFDPDLPSLLGIVRLTDKRNTTRPMIWNSFAPSSEDSTQ